MCTAFLLLLSSPVWLIWNLQSFHACPCRFIGIIGMAIGLRTFQTFFKGIYTPLWSAWVHKTGMFFTGCRIAQIACITFITISSTSLLGVAWRYGLYPLIYPDVTITIGICHVFLKEMFPLYWTIRRFPFSQTSWRSSCRCWLWNPNLGDTLAWTIH